MKKILKQPLLLLLFCFVLAACEKSSVQPTVDNPIFSSAKGRAAFAKSLTDALHIDRNASGIIPESISGTKAKKNPRFIPLFSAWLDGLLIIDESAGTFEYGIFDSENKDKDFLRKNPDGTISGHVNWHNANAAYGKFNFNTGEDLVPPLSGTGAKFSESFTGKWEEFSFEWEGELITFYIFIVNSGYGTYNMHGMGKVGPEGNAPWKNLSVKYVNTPSGGLQTDLSLK